MVEGREVIDFHQSYCKKPRFQPFTLEVKVQRPPLSKMSTWQYFLIKVTNSQREFGLDMIGKPNYGWEAINSCSLTKKIDKILAVRLEGLFWACDNLTHTLGTCHTNFVCFLYNWFLFYFILKCIILADLMWLHILLPPSLGENLFIPTISCNLQQENV